ncbi:hypothetical protein [Rhodococcus ruber]|nr:hypothetical protein [Rhodococcus ruber]
MGLTDLLNRYAARRVHVLPVELPGRWLLRADLDCRIRGRGWAVAACPADADVLAVCGIPGPQLSEVIERIWGQLPGPRVRIDVHHRRAIDSALDHAALPLADTAHQRADASERAAQALPPDDEDADSSGGRHDGHPSTSECGPTDGSRDQPPDHGGSEGGGEEHTGTDHGEMDHGEMEMAPAGIALAEGGPDRDGLEMDVLHLRLGPVLAHWPAGLVLRCSLQGDVVVAARVSLVDPEYADDAASGDWAESGAALYVARECDHITDLLALTGWVQAAQMSRQVRDLLIHEGTVDRARPRLATLHGKVARSRVVRWSLRDLLPVTLDELERYRLPSALAGDTYDRLLRRIRFAQDVAAGAVPDREVQRALPRVVEALPELVTGLEVATVRLVVASLGIVTAPTEERRGHG